MGPPLYMWSIVDKNVITQRMIIHCIHSI